MHGRWNRVVFNRVKAGRANVLTGSNVLTADETRALYRVIDANCNRLREALRVIEEYFRFIRMDEVRAITLKQARHSLEELAAGILRHELLRARDTGTDPFGGTNRPEELTRKNMQGMVAANCKRAQEAARVLEEYLKLTPAAHLSEKAKTMRFSLYALEKQVMEDLPHE